MRARSRVCIATSAALVLTVLLTASSAAQSEVPHRPASDVTTDRIVLNGTLPGLIDAPQQLAVTDNAVWFPYHRAGRVDRLDPKTHQVVASVTIPGAKCDGAAATCTGLGLTSVAADARNVWVYDELQSQLVHIDARTNQVVGSVPTAGQVLGTPVTDRDSVWAALSNSGDVYRISARTNKVVKRVHLADGPAWPLAIVGGTLWAGSYDEGAPPERARRLHRIDPTVGKETKTVNGLTGSAAAVVDGDLWLSGCDYLGYPTAITACPTVSRVDGRSGKVEAEIPVGGHVFATSMAAPHLLAVEVDLGRRQQFWLTTMDTRTSVPTVVYDVAPAEYPGGLGFGHGALWMTNWSENTVSLLHPDERTTN